MGIVKLTGNGEATVWLVIGHVRLGVDDVKVRHLERSLSKVSTLMDFPSAL